MTDEAKELFAEQAHIMWAHWMQYQFSVCVNHLDVTLEPTGGLLIPADMVERWRRQFETPYADLTEQERESDREQADRMSAALASAGYPVEAGPALVEALRKATHELNAIRARDGAPQHIDWYRGRPMQSNGVDPEYFNELVDECHAALAKQEPKP